MPNSTLAQMGFLDEDTQQEAVYDLEDTQARTDISTINGKIPSAASSTNKLVDTTAMNDAIGQAVSAAYKPAGNKTVAELTSSLLVAANRGKVYNMTDAGTTTADFVEGAGHPIRVGDDIGICEPTTGTFKFNILSGFIAVDTNPTQSSANPVSSGGVYSEFAGIKDGQSIDSFGDVETALAGKVDKVQGKGLSTNDYDNTAKGIVDTAQDNIKANTKLIKDTVGWSGKNKLNSNATSAGHITVTNDFKLDVNGTVSAQENLPIADEYETVLPKGNYKLSSGLGAGNANVYITVEGYNGSSWVKSIASTASEDRKSFTLDYSGYNKVYVSAHVKAGTYNHVILEPMIVDADCLDDTYEPYFGSTAFPRSEQAVLGATNLLDVDANTSTQFEKNASGQMTNHTTDTLSTLDFSIQGRKNGSFVKYLVGSQSGHNYISSTGKYEFEFTIEDSDDINQLYIGHKGNSNNVMMIIPFTRKGTFYFSANFVGINPSTQNGYTMADNMVALSSNAPYVPYAMTNRELTDEVSSITNTTFTNATVAPNTITSLGSFTLKKGKYIVTAIASMSKQTSDFDISISFSSSDSAMGGARYDTFNGKAPLAANGGIQATKMFNVTSDTTVYIVVEHNHSDDLALYPAISIAKV